MSELQALAHKNSLRERGYRRLVMLSDGFFRSVSHTQQCTKRGLALHTSRWSSRLEQQWRMLRRVLCDVYNESALLFPREEWFLHPKLSKIFINIYKGAWYICIPILLPIIRCLSYRKTIIVLSVKNGRQRRLSSHEITHRSRELQCRSSCRTVEWAESKAIPCLTGGTTNKKWNISSEAVSPPEWGATWPFGSSI